MPPVRKKIRYYKNVILIHSYNLASVEVGALVRSYSHNGSNPGIAISLENTRKFRNNSISLEKQGVYNK